MAKKSSLEVQQAILDKNVREVMALPAGRAVIWEILSMTPIYVDTFTGNSTTFYSDGKRAVGLSILEMLQNADRHCYYKLLLEKDDV